MLTSSAQPFSQEELTGLRAQFPITQRYVWLNHAGVAPCAFRVVRAVERNLVAYAEHCVTQGLAWEQRVEAVRALCARLIGAQAAEIAFVRNTSHGLGLIAEGFPFQPGDDVLCAVSEEYPSNVYPWQRLERKGVRVVPVSAPEGRIEVDAFRQAGTPRTRLVTVSSVQYASGHRVDLASLGQLCREKGWFLCVDGIQSVGIMPLDVKACGVHFLAADSHKWMLGLAGVGFLYVDEALSARIEPVLVGWRSTTEAFNFDRCHLELKPDASRLEEGTPSYALVDGLGEAVSMLLEQGIERIWAHNGALCAHVQEGLLRQGASLVSPLERHRGGGAVLFKPRRVDPAAFTKTLEDARIIASCRRGAVRISPHLYNTLDELEQVLALLREAEV